MMNLPKQPTAVPSDNDLIMHVREELMRAFRSRNKGSRENEKTNEITELVEFLKIFEEED